jgi:putative FmdB family regulatory protein
MPIFEYRCESCANVFELLHLPGRSDCRPVCPACNGSNLKKLISSPFLPSSVGRPANDNGGKYSGGSSAGNGDAPPASSGT